MASPSVHGLKQFVFIIICGGLAALGKAIATGMYRYFHNGSYQAPPPKPKSVYPKIDVPIFRAPIDNTFVKKPLILPRVL